MRKMLATDLDGTLVEGFDITDDNIKAVKKLEELGHAIAITTGRPYNGVEFLKSKYDITADYFILLNGALIFDKDLNLMHSEELDLNICDSVIKDFRHRTTGVALETGFTTYIVGKGFENFKVPSMKSIETLVELGDDKISLLCFEFEGKDAAYIKEVCDDINEKYGAYLVAYRNTRYIDLVKVGCSKGNALEMIMKKEIIDASRVYSIGDSWNDLSMFKVAGNSFTFTSSEESLKEHVDYVVDSVSECILNNMVS